MSTRLLVVTRGLLGKDGAVSRPEQALRSSGNPRRNCAELVPAYFQLSPCSGVVSAQVPTEHIADRSAQSLVRQLCGSSVLLGEVLDRVAEDLQTGSFSAQLAAGPFGMLCCVNESFRVRH